MREIKYLVWDKEQKRMIKHRVTVARLLKNYISGNTGDGLSSNIFDYSRYVFLQFTGLLDKNENEIYEGDIIAVNEYGWKEKENYEVKYCGDNGYPAFELSGWCQRDCNGLSEISEGVEFQGEVIGNRFENPDLIS
jgi:uncharacterized phage protein (TIGR01671 family)